MENNDNKNTSAEKTEDNEYTIIPMFEEFSDNGEFPTRINDIFGVMA
ncbi:MAG: hypothetical protein VB018_11215 [Lachnospiraceae bacterium]|nr:hypothetical protein [Lachnospiraceae bacterium]